jgi:hypothetical protein
LPGSLLIAGSSICARRSMCALLPLFLNSPI